MVVRVSGELCVSDGHEAVMVMCAAANTTLNELDLSWNCFRSRSAVALVKGLEVTDLTLSTLHPSLSLSLSVSVTKQCCLISDFEVGRNVKGAFSKTSKTAIG